MQQALFEVEPSFTGEIDLSLLKSMRFLLEGGDSVTIDLDYGAPSGKFAKIYDYAMEFRRGSTTWLYDGKSALHKEIRRGNVVDAVRWARCLRATAGVSAVKDYCRRILFEETRNLALMRQWKSLRGLDYEKMVRSLAASKKKWELKCREGLFPTYLHAYRRAMEAFDIDTRDHALSALADSCNVSRLYQALWTARFRDFEEEAWKALCARPDVQGKFRDLQEIGFSRHKHYAPKVLIEILTGHWVEQEANHISEEASVVIDDDIPTVPPFADYIYDNHTREGFARLSEHLFEIIPGEPQPEGIDVRWSGLLIGVLWRETIGRLGLLPDARWEEVLIHPAYWRAARKADKYYYRKLYASAGQR
jgi:hypothetical protein